MHAQRLSSVQKRHTIRTGVLNRRGIRVSVQKRRANRSSVQNRRGIRAGMQKRRANRAVHLGKSQTRQPQLTFSQF